MAKGLHQAASRLRKHRKVDLLVLGEKERNAIKLVLGHLKVKPNNKDSDQTARPRCLS